jgi:hypothetical protein
MQKCLLGIGFLWTAAVIWSIRSIPSSPFFSNCVYFLPMLLPGVVAIVFGLRREAVPDPATHASQNTQTLLPWYLLVAGFPGFAIHVVYHYFHSAFSAAREWWTGSLFIFGICWQIAGAVALSVARKKRGKTRIFVVASYLVGIVWSLWMWVLILPL